jgi:predicted AlkP superfamily pyrophosphatase or phosphodiesterase
MTITEQIYALIKTLPQDQADEILTFAEFIRAKHLNTNQTINRIDQLPWAELVYSLAGTWKDDFPTLEEIRVESGKDIL